MPANAPELYGPDFFALSPEGRFQTLKLRQAQEGELDPTGQMLMQLLGQRMERMQAQQVPQQPNVASEAPRGGLLDWLFGTDVQRSHQADPFAILGQELQQPPRQQPNSQFQQPGR